MVYALVLVVDWREKFVNDFRARWCREVLTCEYYDMLPCR